MSQVTPIHRILAMVTTMLAWPLRLLKPIEPMVKRVLFLTLAKVKIPSLNASIQIDGLITVLGTANVSIGSRSRISRHVELGTEERGEIHIGEQVRINRGSTIFAYEEIRIGDHTLIGEFVTIRDANHGIAAGDHIRSQEHEAQAIHIGTDVWIGRGTVILPGVRIGDHCVIGANSVVTKDIEPGMVAVGSPARAIRER